MRMLDEVTLRARTITTNANGYPVESVTSTTVYADVLSVGQTEYYAAQAAKQRLDIAFIINADEYSGQTEAQHNGIVYDVVRTAQAYEARTNTRIYRADPSKVKLVCARR
jgi:SPP1 family predicted phage head-tail adaptor